MCKVMMIPNVKQDKLKETWDFVVAAAVPMTKYADKDGFGYAAISPDGVFGERWLDPTHAFSLREGVPPEDKPLIEALSGAIVQKSEDYSHFGEMSDKMSGIMLHSRLATCEKSMINTHPFFSGGVALIHNGVIKDPQKHGYINSTCDSEVILKRYLDKQVDLNPEMIKAVTSELEGYYAVGTVSFDANSVPYMDIFKDTAAKLVVAKIKELDTFVYCTNRGILEDTCDALGFTITWLFEVAENSFVRFNTLTGEVMFKTETFKKAVTPTGEGNTGGVSGHVRSGKGWKKVRPMNHYDSYLDYPQDDYDDELLEESFMEMFNKVKKDS